MQQDLGQHFTQAATVSGASPETPLGHRLGSRRSQPPTSTDSPRCRRPSDHAPGHQLASRHRSDPAGCQSRSRLKPSPISDKHVVELVVTSPGTLRPLGPKARSSRAVGVELCLSATLRLTQHDLLAFSRPNTQAPAYCTSPTPFCDSASIGTSPQLGPPSLTLRLAPEGRVSAPPVHQAPTHYSVALPGFWSVELFTRAGFPARPHTTDDARHRGFRHRWLPHRDTLTGCVDASQRKHLRAGRAFRRRPDPCNAPMSTATATGCPRMRSIRDVDVSHPKAACRKHTTSPRVLSRATFTCHGSGPLDETTTDEAKAFLGRP